MSELEMRNKFEETELFKSILKLRLKPYFKIGHYFVDGDEDSDKFLCGAWEMFQELNK